jgi:hypothetical protein
MDPSSNQLHEDKCQCMNSSKASAMAVARNSSGGFVGASVVVTQRISDPEIVEAVACRDVEGH